MATIKRFEYSLLDSDLKKQPGIAKDQYQYFKDQINILDNNKEYGSKVEDIVKLADGAKREDDQKIDKMRYFYIGDEFKSLIW